MLSHKTTEIFVEESIKVHGNKYDYKKTRYKNNRDNVIITCKIHGDFNKIPFTHLQGQGCPKCGINQRANLRRLTNNQFKNKAIAIHGDKYDYKNTRYLNANTKVKIKCPIHGYFTQTPSTHLKGAGCLICGHKKTSDSVKNSCDYFIELSNKIHNNKFDYSKVVYVNNDTKVIITCPKHGDFEQTPRSHISKKGCWKCKASHGEKALIEIFNKYNIDFIHEFTLPLYNKLRYDFYIPSLNILIEFHGGQHFFPVKFFGGEEGLNYIRTNDIFKKNLAYEYNKKIIYFTYKHLRMPKEEFEKFVLFVLNKFKLGKSYIDCTNQE